MELTQYYRKILLKTIEYQICAIDFYNHIIKLLLKYIVTVFNNKIKHKIEKNECIIIRNITCISYCKFHITFYGCSTV